MATPSIPNKLLAAPLLALLLAACDTELTAVAIDGLDAPGTPSITSFSEVNGEAEVSWSKLSGADGNNWRLYRNDLNICEEALAPSADGSQSGSCSVMLEEGTNQLYVRLCNIDSSGSSACSESNTYTHNYQPEDQSDLPPGAITLEELSSPTYDPELYVAWSKASGVNGDSWGIYRDESLVCSGSLADSSSQVPQSGGCYVELEIGVNQLHAELCISKPVGIDDLCTQSASASVTRDYDPGQILAQPILDDLATSAAVIGPLTVAWSKDTSLGTLGETWSLYHNDSEICSGELAADASGASCLVDIALGANQLQVELCTEFYTYSGASCAFSEALSVEGGYPSAVEPGAIDLRSSYLSETYEATVSARWAIDSGNGVQSWMVLVNGSSYCAVEATETYHLDGECEQVGLELGDNNISVYGCNYGLDGSEACIYSDSKSVLRLELPGQAEIIDLPASSYDGELELSWERTSGASAESWLALVNDEIACPQTDLSADAATQSGSCTIELASGHNSVVVRLCVADSQASSYCSDSDTGSVELLAPIPGTAVITTASQTIAAASITLEWEKSSGEAATNWQLYNNSLPVEECAGVLEGSGAQQQGSCSLPLEEGTNLILIELCNSNAAGTASCSSSTSVSIDRELVTPAFTSSASATVPENTLSSFYTASASDSDSASSSLSFFITGGADSSFFGIDDASGALSFSASPDFEAAADSDGDNIYEVGLEVFDEHRNGDSLALQVSLSDLDDTAPTFTSAASTTTSENSAGIIYLASAIDADSTSWSFALADGADSSHFELNSSSGELSPTIVLDFENPQDSNQDNTYELGLTATDPAANSSELSLSITVSGEYDEAPVVPQEPQAIAVQLGELSVGSVIYSVTATDSDAGDQLTYTLSGVDAGHFNLDSSSGELSFLNLPTSLNDPQDANGDHIYETAVSVHDLGANSSSFDLNISVAFGAPPEFNSAAASVEFPENSTAVVYTAAATDPEGDAITYSLGGADVDLFTIDTGSGAISFNTIPDYEAPSGTDNNYNLTIFASDPLGNQSQQSLEVTVTNLNDNAPEFASASDSVGVSENSSGTIYTASATDVDNDSLVYSVAGADVNLFAIAISSGELRFINAPDFENPLDGDADNAYELEISASDGADSATLMLSVVVADANDNAPGFASASDSVQVNEDIGGVIYTANATDADAIDTLAYSLAGADADLFGIDTSSGELSFITPPDYEHPLDADSDNVYELTIDASDGVNHDSLALVVEVIDLNDNGPRFASSSDSVSVPENNTGTIYTASATDADDDDLSYGLAGVDAALFTLDPGSGELAFVAAPDFENPLDADADNAYELEISASDGISSSTLALSVVVTDANDNAPGFALESDAIAVEEGISGTIYTASATDPDVSDSLTYSLTGTDSSLFSVDSSSGELSFKNAPDFESPLDQGADNTYELTIQATDGANNTSLALSVAVEGINDNSPEFVTNSDSITVEEDASGTIYTAVATDLDGDSLRYGLSGTDSSLFAVNANNGVVSFANPPDFENPLDQGGDNTYELNIQASDGTSSATLALTVVVIDINDNFPSFALTNDSVAVAENSGGTIYTATATDLDATDSLTYSLAGTDYSYFAIDGSSGALSFKNSPDFENPLDQGADNTYELNIQASDGVNASALTLSVAVNNLNDNAPGFGRDSFSLSTAENNSDTIYTAAASDADGDTLAYSLAGTDSSLFAIDSANGELSFATAPDFEGAEDSNNDNSYELEIVASDGEQSAALALQVSVTDLNDESPQVTSFSSLALSIFDITLYDVIYTVTATDADAGDQLSYALSGADASHFQLGSISGELSFIQSPSSTSPRDADADNVYEITITASDSANNSSSIDLRITLDTDIGNPPVFDLAHDRVTISENSSGVFYTAVATDPEGNVVTFGLSGTDASYFSIDSASGELSLEDPLDYEQPRDSGHDNNYTLTILASDHIGNQAQQGLDVLVSNVNDNAPEFALLSDTVAVAENSTDLVYTASASDADGDTMTYSLGGDDAALFDIGSSSGELFFYAAPDYEQALDSDQDNSYNLTITATDGASSAGLALTVTVDNLNDTAPQFELSSDSFDVVENSTVVTTIVASDADGDDLTFALVSSADSSWFSLDSSGVLAFAPAPDFETPADDDSNNAYQLELSVFDGSYTTSAAVTVMVTDLDEAPGFAAATLNLSISENNDSIIYTAAASDPEQASLVYSASGADAALFTLNTSSGELSFISAPDYEAPLDQGANNTYQLDITASDGEHEASQSLSITITDVNEAPGFATASVDLSTAENDASFAYTAEAATDPDQNEQLSYQLSGADETAFSFDANTRTLSFATTPDYENPADQDQANDYEVSVIASDGEYQSTQTIAISVTDLNDESPLFTSPSSQAVDYTTVKIGDVVYTAQATDADSGDQITYTLGGADASHFELDSASGALAFNQLPSFEDFLASGGVTYQLTITATDLNNNSSVLDLTINLVDDTGNPPEFSQASVSIDVAENTAGSIYQAAATDADGDALSYSISGVDYLLFSIDSSSGELSFNSAPDYEQPADNGANNVYELSVAVTDSIGKQAQQSLEVTVTNLNDNQPQFNLASDAFSVAENTTAVTTIAASDADGDDFTFALVTTADSNLFSLDATSGELAFVSAPDFEAPLDAGTDNSYELELSVFDGDYTTTQAITIAVTNIDEAPSFAIVTVDLPVNENTSGSIHTASATDPEQATLTYSASGPDASLFTLDSSSGELSFNSVPDFETPLDADADNVYQLDLTASDGTLTSSQALSVTITDVNEPHSFASTSVSLLIDENNLSFAYIVEAAADEDQNQQLTYQLGGTDQAAFDFDASTRTLSFKANPDFETPADADGQNDYQVSITAADADYSASQDIAISVADVNDEAPRFTSLSSQAVDYTEVSVGEIIYTATATDADAGDQISFTLGGADASYFIFNGSNGWLAFNQLPDLEDVPEDTGIAYEITITATDLANNSSVLDLTIRLVDDTGSSPEFDQASANIAVDENTADSFYTAVATDVDVGDTLTYSLTGIDSDHFTIDPSSGELAFNSAPDYEAPADYGANNVYELSVAATDSIGKQAQQSLEVTINNLNDNQPQFDLTSDSFDIAENTTAVTTIAASDADGNDLTFSLTTSTDASFFSLNASSGVLAFVSAPDFESAQDSNADNTYELELNVFDGSHTTTESVSVTVTNVDEAPSFASANESLSVSENTGDAVYQAQASDPEGATLTYSSSGADVGLFTLDSTSGELSFKQSPDYEQATDQDGDNVYELTITASDGANQVSQSLAITVTNVNEAPAFASASVNLNTDENAAGFTHIVDAADDPDQGETLTYQLGGDDAVAFDFDTTTRALAFKQSPDYESPADQGTNNVYQVTITAADAEYSTTQAITITVADLNDESPQFTSASSLVLDYTSVAVDTTIYTVQATDADAGDQITYTLSGADQQHFSFAASSGELAFVQAPSLESPKDDNGDNSYELVITATDSAGNSSDLDLSISVVDDTGSAPTFTQVSVSINVDENNASSVYTAQASDVDPGDTLTYSISGTDSSYFTIDPSSGDLAFNTAPDYENPSDDGKDNTYELSITATDSMAKQAQQSLTISINNLNDNAPQFDLSANSFDVAENTTAVTTVSASDADGDDLTFSLTNSTDSNLFTLDSTSGALAFISAPDFETPQDSNADNTYDLELNVFDGANTTTQSVSVTVTNVDESPSFASASQSLSVSENSSGAVYQAQASDPEQATLSYSASGTDAGLFDLDSASGVLSFKATPDFEAPIDSGADNVYELSITATDGANQVSQSLAITVTNVNEAPSFTTTSVNLNTDENDASFTHTVDAADDPDQGETLTYQLGGDDAADFNFDSSTRSLSFANTPDFETPADQDGDNAYQIDIIASDGEYETTQSIAIVVTDLNDEAPQFTSASSLVLDYTSVVVGTTIYTAQATDADAGDSVVYTLGGADSSAFSFDSSSGELAFTQLPSLDSPQDDNGDNSYELVITATDSAGNSNDLDLSINVVDDTGSAPTFAQASVSINVDENVIGSVYTAQATDVDAGDTLTYSISGTDSSYFTIDPSGGELAFNTAPDYESPSDDGKDNTYELSITATDSMAKQAQQSLTISINNLNDNAPQFVLASTAFDVLENSTSVTTIAATDADGDDLTFSLTNSTDSNLFSLDSSSGVLAFTSAPNFENPADNNTDNTYELELSVFDGGYTTTQAITITVTNIDEAPSFAIVTVDLPVSENTSGSIHTASATDPEQATLTYSASGTDAGLFDLDPVSGELRFNSTPDYEQPSDDGKDNTYNLSIIATDGANQASQSLSITVTNVNEAPSFASTSVSLNTDENAADFAHTVEAATDPDQGETLTYQLGGDDAAAFDFDAATRTLSFKQVPDFETPADQDSDNAYQIDIIASDGEYETTQSIAIVVTDLNDEAPQFTSASSLVLDYTSVVVGTTIYTAQATDADAGDSVVYTLGGADSSAFSFDSSSGELAFTQLPSLDSPQDDNGDNSYELVITATDSAGNSNDLDLSIKVVDDTGSSPIFDQANVSIDVDENSASTIYTAQATDSDPGDTLTYSIDGTDAELFTINSSSGELSFNSAPDFENPSDNGKDNTYDLTITATDTIGKSANQDLAITILNLNDNPPQFALSANSFDVAENTTAITTVAANDVDGDDLTFSLTNSTDASFFSLDSSSGVLAFTSAPDFETAEDSNADNTYDLELNVFDGANTTTESISVTVTNVDEAPSFASANESLSVSENTSDAVYQAQASDPEQATLTYSASGTDAGLFDLDPVSGELRFNSTPDYEQPSDDGKDNTYNLSIIATDGANQVNQSLSITVTNVNEAPSFASASVNLNIDENDASFTHTVDAADDPDQGETLTYQLGGDDAADFNFDSSTRSLAFKTTPDYESPADQDTNNAYQITITASDGDLEATQAITITVANVEESPYFHSTTDHVEITEDPATEGTASPVLALSIQAADDEDDFAGTSLNFVISGGADSDKFSLTAIGANSANLSFVTSPDFDNPHDANLDSNYSLTIQVTDSSGAQAQHDLIVQVLGVNDETPQLSSGANADVTENSTAIFYVASATDADRSDWSDSDSSKHYQPNLDSITFSLDSTNYPDSSFFSINSSSGDLQATSGLDYETPQSSAQSNNYTVGIKVADQAGNSSTSPVTITVIDDPDEPEPVASSGPQIPWFYSDVSVGESIDIPWVIYSGDGAISWSMLVNGTTVCSESASISAPVTSGVCSVSSSYLTSGSNLNTTEVSVTYSDSSSESSEAVSFGYAVSATTSRYPTPTASVSDGIAACQNVDIGDAVSSTSNVDCWNFLLGNDDFGGPYDEVPSYLTANYGRGFDVIAYYGDWSIYERGFQPAHMPVNLLSTALYSFIMLDGDIPATQAANADEKECEDCSFSGAVDFADYYSAIHKAYSLPDDPLATDKWLGTEGVGDGYVAYGTGIGEHWTDDSAYKGNGIFKQFWLLKQKFPHFKTCISVGGWSFSRPFPLIASDSTKLATFVESITDMAVKYHFDCIDIDWEFPGKAGGDYVNNNSAVVYDYDGDGKTPFITPTAADAGYFVNLISALRAELDSRSEASHIEINSAVYTSEDGMALMDYNAFAGNLDGIHMMTYDYYGAWDAHTGLQAALYANSDPVHSEVSVLHGDVYNNKHNIASAMARAVNNAIDNGFGSNHDIRRKIVPGLAFYGRNYSGVSTTPVPGKYMVLANSAAEQLSWEQGNLNYIQIEGYYEDGDTMYGNSAYDAGGYSTSGRSWTYRWDSESMAPFLYDASTGSFIGYTDPRATFYQTCHAARENSKGVMFWEMTQDSSDFQLVQAIHTAIRGDTMTQYADQPHCDDIIDRDTTSNNDDSGGGNDDDDDGGDTGGGDTGGDTSSGTSGLQELEDLGYFTETVFNSLFYNTTLNQGSSTDGACTGYSFFNNWLDLKEAATYYPDFAGEGSMEDRLRELAAFLANTSHETTGAWQTYALDPALGARYHYGYCFKEEVGCENQTSCTQYCDSNNTEYGYACSLGTTYHGRGPIQFTWNYNYGPMSEVLYGNNNYTLLENPSILVTDAVISYRSALWFWMTVQAPKPSAHDVMIGNYSAEASKNRYPGFGMTINIINGGLECGTDDFAEAKNKNRLGFYLAYLKVLGDAYGSEISPWVTESSTSITYGSTPANYSAFDLNEADLISRYTDVETYLSCKNMEHY